MSIRMSREDYRCYLRFMQVINGTVIFWLIVGIWLIPGCQEFLPDAAKEGFAQLDALVGR